MYNTVYIDLLNYCNAKCPYCLTGKNNRCGKNMDNPKYNITVDEFKKIFEHLLDKKIISPDCEISLYNWYEPCLSENVEDIFNYLDEVGLKYVLSTNGSKTIDFKKVNSFKNLNRMLFSMPGFSQNSYDKVHGFNFEMVKENIASFARNLRQKEFTGDAYIAYHVYQFNIGEVYEAKKFAEENGIGMNCYYAYFNSDGFYEYVTDTMDSKWLKEVSKDLFFNYVDELIASRPDDYVCEQSQSLTISEHGNLLRCCGCNDDDALGSIFDFNSYEEIVDLRKDLEACKRCREVKMDIWCENYDNDINHLFNF